MMKKNKIVLYAISISLSAMLFAEKPESLKKQATGQLFEDSVIDNLDEGIEGSTGLIVGGYNPGTADFDFGFGSYFKKTWFSIYDQGYINSKSTFVDGKMSGYKSKSQVDEKNANNAKHNATTQKVRDTNNNLYVSINNGKINSQFYWLFVNDDDSSYKNSTETNINEPDLHYKGTVVDTESKTVLSNDIGAYINNAKTKEKGKNNLYFSLDKVGLLIETDEFIDRAKDNAVNTSDEKLSSKSLTEEINNKDMFKPYVKGTLGMDLPAMGKAQSKLTLEDEFMYYIYASKHTNITQTTSPEINGVQTIVDEKTNYSFAAKPFDFKNTFVPKITTTYNVGKDIEIKSSIGLEIETEHVTIGNDIAKTNRTTTVITDGSKDTTSYSSSIVNGNGSINKITNTFTTKYTPELCLGIVYPVKPGKFDLNLGAKWYPTTLVHKLETTSNDSYKNETNDNGTITGNVSTTAGTPNTVTNEFTFRQTTVDDDDKKNQKNLVFLGATYHFTDAVKVDCLATAGINDFSIWNSFMQTKVSLQFSVLF